MALWRDEDVARFLGAFDSYWPGRLKLQDPRDALVRTWRDVAQAFSVAVAMAALQELFEGQERLVAPTPAAFRGVAVPMQRYANARAREWRHDDGPILTAKQIAEDEPLWDALLDQAANEGDQKRHAWLLRCRERLRTGGPLMEPKFAQMPEELPPIKEPEWPKPPEAAPIRADLAAHREKCYNQDAAFMRHLELKPNKTKDDKRQLANWKRQRIAEAYVQRQEPRA